MLKHGESAYPADAWVEQQYMKEDAFTAVSFDYFFPTLNLPKMKTPQSHNFVYKNIAILFHTLHFRLSVLWTARRQKSGLTFTKSPLIYASTCASGHLAHLTFRYNKYTILC